MRPIRSFVLRQGRLTSGQKKALRLHWSRFGIDLTKNSIPIDTFFDQKPLWLEIGFGNGESLLKMAADHPEHNYIGVEVHAPGVGHCLMRLAELQLPNLRLIQSDVMHVLDHFNDHCLSGVQIFFPDPWPKKRHHKRRLIQTDFLNRLHRVLKIGGIVHLATDQQDYAQWILEKFNASGWQNLSPCGDYIPRPADRPMTKFEQRGIQLGHGVWDLKFRSVRTAEGKI